MSINVLLSDISVALSCHLTRAARPFILHFMSNELTIIERPRSKYLWATDQEVIDALEQHAYHVAATARFFGVKRRVLQTRIDETVEIQAEITDFKEEIADDSELHFLSQAKKGKWEAVTGVMNSGLGAKRGYGKQNIALPEGIEVVIRRIGSE